VAHGKGYQRAKFKDSWERYLGASDSAPFDADFERCKRASASATDTSSTLSTEKNDTTVFERCGKLSYSPNDLHACTDEKAKNGLSSIQTPASFLATEEKNTTNNGLHVSKDDDLSYSPNDLHACTDEKTTKNSLKVQRCTEDTLQCATHITNVETLSSHSKFAYHPKNDGPVDPCETNRSVQVETCVQCNNPDGKAIRYTGPDYPHSGTWLHRGCRRFWLARRQFQNVGDAPAGTLCTHCRQLELVFFFTHKDGTFALHDQCALTWFDLRGRP
jgi:hypothetical protein